MESTAAYWLLALPVIMAVAAVGALLLIKTTRRRQGTRDPRYTRAVPVNPLSPADARKLRRRYAIAAGAVGGGLLLLAVTIA